MAIQTQIKGADYFTLKELPYEYDALKPAISAQTLHLHHDKHYATYLNNLNRLIEDTRFARMSLEEVVLLAKDGAIFNNAAQVWNHEFYFAQFSPNPQTSPTGSLLEDIEQTFGSFDDFKRIARESATSLFGSGWVWLVVDDAERLTLQKCSNAENPITENKHPIFTIDVWEHAYYCDYENRRAEAVDALWSVVDWRVIERRYLSHYL